MDNSLIQKYKNEMLDMYRKSRTAQMSETIVPTITTQPETPKPQMPSASEDSQGELIAIVTSLRGIYPVAGAKVTVFTGNYNDMQIIDTAFTDQSGRTRPFTLKTPAKQLSLESDNTAIPYSTYNLQISAEGYLDNLHINIPVFSGVTSIQRSNMMLVETANDITPQVFDESSRFDL